MKPILAFVIAAFIPFAAVALDDAQPDGAAFIQPAGDTELSEFLWINRPVIVFADSPADPRFAEQLKNLSDGMAALLARDVVVLTDTDPSARSPIRTELRPRGFMLVLMGKDGGIILRKPLPWTVREISRSIDKTPERQREVSERRGDG